MSEVIIWEIYLFFKCMLLGIILRAIYDIFLILRKLKKPSDKRIAAEDFIYWMSCCYFVFGLLYRENNGSPRGFAIAAFFIGMGIYHFGMSRCMVAGIIQAMQKISHILKKIVNFLCKPLKKIYTWFTMKK